VKGLRKTAVVIAAVWLAAVSARAQQALVEGKWWKRPRIAQALALTPQQTTELEQIFAKSKPKLIDLKADLEKKQFEYQQEMSAEKVDRKQIEATIAAREQARARLQTELSLMELDMKQVLTPDQREKAQQLRAEIGERLREKRRALREADTDADLPAPRNARPAPTTSPVKP
jgi:Spy/CpxP family protein refolding chaperone